MKQFLETIWGDFEGTRCVVSSKNYTHQFTETNKDAVALAVKSKAKKDVWYAMSIFSKAERKIENVVATKAFWLDIDIKENTPNAYNSLTGAVTELSAFITKFELPDPTIIKSGNGLHVYWILDRHIVPAKWHRIAKSLHMACAEEGFLADAAITIDIARILRVPDTKNFKDEAHPKSVELLTPINICTYEQLETSLDSFTFRVELQAEAVEKNKQFLSDLPQTPKDAHTIADKCGQMALLRDTRGNLPEPQWYASLGVLALCKGGIDIAQEWSSGHATYSAKATSEKFERAKEFAPTTCAKFYEVNPATCQKCPFYQKVVTPMQLDMESVTPVEVLIPSNSMELEVVKPVESLVPKPYIVGKEGVFQMVAAEDGEAPERQRIMEHPLWVSRLMIGENGEGSEIEISWITAQGKLRKASISARLLASSTAFDDALRFRHIHFFWQIKAIIPYINACINHVAKQMEEEIVYNKFGFNEDMTGFVLGRDFIRKEGRQPAHIAGRIETRRVDQMTERGTIEGWKKATKLLDEPRFWMHRFTVLASLGTPLFALSGNDGSVLSLAGESSGGKTTAANLGIAAFANPEAFTIDPASTMKSYYEHWRQASNLPLVVNEAATIKKDILTNLVLAAANGKARDTMTQDGRLHESGTWQTLTIFTSNTHLLALSDSVITEAARRRILELSFDPENCLPLSIGRPINAAIERNYGVAGRLFMDFVMQNPEAVAKAVNERVEALQIGIDSVHRYNVWLIAAASVAGDIADDLGLIDFQYEDALANALTTLKDQAGDVKTPIERVTEFVAEWLAKFQMQIGVKEMDNTSIWMPEPIGQAKGRYNSKRGAVYEVCLPITQFKDAALESGIDINHINQFVKLSGAKEVATRLSRHGSSIRCYAIPHLQESV